MAITKQLRDEADRAIAGITSYYEQYGDALLDADEREHRISKVVTALEGCNGITDKEKLQKTAENLFGLTCAWERDSLALKRELMLNREQSESSFKKLQEDTNAEFTKLGANMNSMDSKIDKLSSEIQKLAGVADKYNNETKAEQKKLENMPWYYRFIGVLDRHFGAAAICALIFFALVILSGNLELVSSALKK